MGSVQCELCNGKNLVKDGDHFVCQTCGAQYTVEAARSMMHNESVVQVKDADYVIEAGQLLAYHGVDTDVRVPEGVTKVSCSFPETTSSITFPSTIAEIGPAFSLLPWNDFVIPAGVTSVFDDTFPQFQAIETIRIEGDTTILPRYASQPVCLFAAPCSPKNDRFRDTWCIRPEKLALNTWSPASQLIDDAGHEQRVFALNELTPRIARIVFSSPATKDKWKAVLIDAYLDLFKASIDNQIAIYRHEMSALGFAKTRQKKEIESKIAKLTEYEAEVANSPHIFPEMLVG